MKTVWLINQYAMPPQYESRLRTIKFAQYLVDAGYDVQIFSASALHNFDINLITDSSKYIKFSYGILNFVHIKTPSYGENKVKRIFSSILFACRILRYSNRFKKPDIIVQTATVPFGNILYFLAKKYKAQYIVEVLDLWPESFVEEGLMSRKNIMMKFAYQAEKWLYRRADELVFSMEGGKQYLIDKKWNKEQGGPIDLVKVHYINNGVDLDDFNSYRLEYKYPNPLLEEPNIRRVIYIGSVRLANNVRLLIEAAQELSYLKNVKFLIFGDGSERIELENYCKDNNISNVCFCDKWVDPKFVPYIVSCAYINILNYKPHGFGHYGGSQSKMFQYMASARPICCNINMMFCPIRRYNLGISKEFQSSKEYSEAILSLLNLSLKEYNEIANNNVETAKLFDYKVLTNQLIALFK